MLDDVPSAACMRKLLSFLLMLLDWILGWMCFAPAYLLGENPVSTGTSSWMAVPNMQHSFLLLGTLGFRWPLCLNEEREDEQLECSCRFLSFWFQLHHPCLPLIVHTSWYDKHPFLQSLAGLPNTFRWLFPVLPRMPQWALQGRRCKPCSLCQVIHRHSS